VQSPSLQVATQARPSQGRPLRQPYLLAQQQGSAFELQNHSAFVELVPQTMVHPGVQQLEHLQ